MADLTSQSEIEYLLSETGVSLRLDDDEDGSVVGSELSALTEAIDYVTELVESYLGHWYTNTKLSGSTIVRRWASYLAAHELAVRRGNGDVFCKDVERIMARMERMSHGNDLLPNLSMKRSDTMGYSANWIDQRYHLAKSRVVEQVSSTPYSGNPNAYSYWPTFYP